MNLSNVNIGTGPSAGDGDPIRTAFGIVNNNFAYIQSNINSLTNSVTTVAGRTGNVILTVNDIVGLSNAYAISSATTTANTGMRGYVDTTVAANIAALINGAPGALDTIQELAAALGNNASYAATITNSLASTNSNITLANTVMRGYVDGQISAANSVPNTANIGMKGYVDNAVSTANLGIKGYVDQANTIQSAQITTANLGIKGYIDLANTIQSAQITAGNLGIIGYVNSQVTAANVAWQANSLTQSVLINSLNTAFVNLAANAEIQQGNIYSLETSIATVNNSISLGNTIQSAQIVAANVGVIGYIGQQITTANIGIKGYIDLANTTQQSLITTANVGIIGYIDRGNTIVTAGITTANLGMIGYVDNKVSTANVGVIGYIDLGNTIQTAQMTAANIGMKGYVDSVATLSIYSNVNAKAYTESMGYQNFGNVNVAAYVTTSNSAIIGYVDQANTIQSAQVGAANLAITAANVGMKGYVDSQSFYSNTKVATYLQAGNISNVSVAGNITATYFVGNGALLTGISGGISSYSNVQVATYLPTYSGNVANVRLGTSGVLTFADGTTQTTASAGGGSSYGNANVTAYTESMGFQNYGNVNVAAYVTTANSAIIGYIDQANTIQSAQVNAANLAIIAANLGMKGYVDSVASQSIYGNGNVKSYLTQFNGNIVPSANVTYSLGNVTNRWKDLYISGNTIFLGDSTISTEGGRLVTTGVAISPPTGAVGFANVQFEAPTDFAQIRSYYVDNNFGYTANLKSWSSAPIVWDELRSSKIKINSNFVTGYPSDFASLDTSGGRFANAIATLDATGNIASLTITDGGIGYDAYYPYYATDSTGYDNNYIGQPFNSGSPTGKSFRRIGLIPTTATNVGNITSVASFTRYSGLPTVGTNTYHWIGNTGSNVSITINWASNTVTSYTYIPALPALTSANDWQNWLLDYQATNNYGWNVGSGSITGQGGSPIQAVYDYLNREALPNSLTYDLSNNTWYPGNLLVNNSATIATLSSQTFFVYFNRTAIGYATVENSYGNPVYWSRGLTADSGISTGGDMTVAGDLRVAGDLFVSPTSIYMGNLRISAADGNLTVNTGVKFSDSSVQSSAYSNVKVKAYTESMGYQNYGNVNVAALITTNGLTNYSNVNVIAYLAGNITVGNIAGSVNGYSIGYRDVPQITVANLTLIASDAGKHYYGANTNPTTITIPLNSSVAFGNGTAISIVNQGTGNITVANVAGVLLYLAGNSTAGSRTLTSYGMATLIKVQVNTWFINGTGVV